jgi:hypothetical protein
MEENTYILDILSGLGLAINEKNNTEIVINYPIIFNKKNMEFIIDFNYKTSLQPIGTFLADFLNANFEEYNDFLAFFLKYSLSLLDSKKIKSIFKDGHCSEHNFKEFILNLQNKNKTMCIKLQKQIDMILDYCLLTPNKTAKNYKPIERLYVLRRISPSLTVLNEHKDIYYSTNLFSSYPQKSEKQIYDFLSHKKNSVTEYDLLVPSNISSILYKSLCSILNYDVYLKICKNCSKYFIAYNKAYNYCQNIAPNETVKTCREIGRRTTFENSKDKDPILTFYYKTYSRKSMMKSRNPDIDKYTTEFNKFKENGKKKLIKYKDGKLSAEDFKTWIEKNN